MLKRLALILAFLVFPMRGQLHKEKQGEQDKPPTPLASNLTIASQQDANPNLKSPDEEHISADVKVVTSPAKDDWDKAAVWINIGLALIGSGGMVVALLTLRKIERQTKATEDTVIAARTAYSLAEDTAKRQLRAYITMETAEVRFPVSNQPLVRINFKNCGQTPAYEVQAWMGVCVLEYSPSPDLATQSEGVIGAKNTIGAGGRTQFASSINRLLTLHEMAQLGTSQLTLYAYGQFSYKDVFGDKRHTNFRLIAGGPEGAQRFLTKDESVRWALCPDVSGNDVS